MLRLFGGGRKPFEKRPAVRYEYLIGLRYLRARRRERFVSLIAIISLAGTLDVFVKRNSASPVHYLVPTRLSRPRVPRVWQSTG